MQVTSEEAIENYKPLLEGYDCVCYDVVDHSYNELYKLAESVVDSLPDKKAFAEYYVDIKENKAIVCILKEYQDKIKEFVPSDDRLVIDYSKGYIVDTSSIVGGSGLMHGGDDLTLGGSGTYGSNVAFLTCGHGLSYGDQIWQASQYIGSVSVIQFSNYQAGDYSIIIAQPGYTATSAVKNSGGPFRFGTHFCGIIKGHDDVTHRFVYFTPYGYPYYAGFTIKTT